jgi:hypothetical protein
MLLAMSDVSTASIHTVPFDDPGLAVVQTQPIGVDLFASNSSPFTGGISSLFTGNAAAPIGPPRALSLGASPGPFTYFHFSPLPGFEINHIGISATGAVLNQSTTFRVFAAFEDASFVQFDTTMTPTGPGIAGLNGGAVFLEASSASPITAFRVWQLDDGFGVLDNLVVDIEQIQPVPEATSLVAFAGLFLCAGVWQWRKRHRRAPRGE